MNLRTKKALGVFLRGMIFPAVWTVCAAAGGGHRFGFTWGFLAVVALSSAIAGYAWW
ncbi:hypothetical protein [Streptomyces sp. TLI_171]|uniref:hypothetical protein n=1 Tax=Streptomyces sp. TLI_171 TaxID=1938859 RepID=UPI000C499C02|nr:hypothetical protein [Streptomyces sp. TLI_171]RKE05088.1 hypothetical protein BX266_7343 [Streptomyces sp. TLI_171]